MKMSQAIEKYMKRINGGLTTLSDGIKLVPLNKWAEVLEVIEGSAQTWPDEKFLNQFESYEDGDTGRENVTHKKADFMLFTQGACRGHLLAYDFDVKNSMGYWGSNNEEKLKGIFKETNTTNFKLVLFKLPESVLTYSVRQLGTHFNEIKLFNQCYFNVLEDNFKIFTECDDDNEIPLDIPVLSIPIKDILLCEQIFDKRTIIYLELLLFYMGFKGAQGMDRIHKVLAMKSGVSRGAKLIRIIRSLQSDDTEIKKHLMKELNNEIEEKHTAVIARLKGTDGKMIPESFTEELRMLFSFQSIFQILGIRNGFERIASMNQTDAIKYMHSIIPEYPNDIIKILIKKCNLDKTVWPSSELIKLFPLYRIPDKADTNTLAFYCHLNVLLLESVFTGDRFLSIMNLRDNDSCFTMEELTDCVRLEVNSNSDLFEVFKNPKGIMPRKLYMSTASNQIKHIAALLSATCNVELSFSEPESSSLENILNFSYYALNEDWDILSQSLFDDLDRIGKHSCPELMVLPRSFTYDDFFAPLWQRIINTGRIKQIENYATGKLGIVIAAETQKNVTINNKAIPYTEITKFSCLEPEHYRGVMKNTSDYSDVPDIGSKPIGNRIEAVDNGNISLLDTLLMQPVDYSTEDSNEEAQFVTAGTTSAMEQSVCLRCCHTLLPDYLAMMLEKYRTMIFWGTIPGKAGDAERIKRIKQIRIPELSLKEQLRELFPQDSDSAVIDDAIEMRLKFDEAAERFLSENISAETIGLMVNGIILPDGDDEYFFMYNIKSNELRFLRNILSEIEKSSKHIFQVLRYIYLNKIITEIEQNKNKVTFERNKSDNFMFKVFIKKVSDYISAEINIILKAAGISEPMEETEIHRVLAEFDNKIIYEKERQLDAEKTRAEERKKVIADMSHHIKNLVRSVIDPLELLKEDDQEHLAIIDNALRGAELIREIVNAMNLSFSGSTEGVIYDFNTPSHDSIKIQDILISGLRNAVSNMFDGKYFKQFGHGYFPDKSRFIEAKQQWQMLDIVDIDGLKTSLNQYFFKLDIQLLNADILVVGNKNSTATKLLIMFQEIMLNAVKYTSFVSQTKRKIIVMLTVDGSRITLAVENTFNPKSTIKSSGLGHMIINNFAGLLGAKVDKEINGELYKIKIEFDTNPEGLKASGHAW